MKLLASLAAVDRWDVVFLAGVALTTWGVWEFSPPAAKILLGLAAVFVAVRRG